ncbi:unnamed protein product [Cuscuta campestris]|uniref:Reverse transcriptase domain-containing protein n=1 Tax=Cuscuta campestris TaxID=132261 RepID=A0A484N9T7_9ASTE|nr:unnamed protein product [Cuscuta campestris]
MIEPKVIEEGKTLNIQQQLMLIKPISPQKIKEIIFGISSTKSPGPNGFGSGFFKKQWHVVGTLVTEAVMEFFQKDKTLNQVISKIICGRLRGVLKELVNWNQGAFVEGRELLQNVLLCQELARGYGRKNISPRCLLKLDIRKAYDSVSWEAVRGILTHMKFPEQFVRWVIFCVTTPSYSLVVNGEPHGYFKGTNGLRQGDPISPLLFVLVMEYLTSLFSYSTKISKFRYHPMCASLKVVNLIFADDLIVGCKADVKSVKVIMEVLERFNKCTGLQINKEKSSIVFGGCKEDLEKEIISITQMNKGELPFTYLGCPISSSRLSIQDCDNLVEKICAKITTWSSKHLTYAGDEDYPSNMQKFSLELKSRIQ